MRKPMISGTISSKHLNDFAKLVMLLPGPMLKIQGAVCGLNQAQSGTATIPIKVIYIIESQYQIRLLKSFHERPLAYQSFFNSRTVIKKNRPGQMIPKAIHEKQC